LTDLGLKEAEIEAVIAAHSSVYTQVRKAEGHFSSGSTPKGAYAGFSDKLRRIENPLVIFDLNGIENLEKSDVKVCIHVQGNLLSHAAAWCRQKGITYLICNDYEDIDKIIGKYVQEVSKGWVILTDTPNEAVKIKKESFVKPFWKGLLDGKDVRILEDTPKIWSCYVGFQHYASGVTENKETAYLAGFFVSVLLRTAILEIIGEFRHYSSRTENALKVSGNVFWELWEKLFSKTFHFDNLFKRETIYKDFDNYKYSRKDIAEVIKVVSKSFSSTKWCEGYGGRKWRKFANMTLELISAIENRKRKDVILIANNLLAAVHNSGWAFNKLLDKAYLNRVYDYTQEHRVFLCMLGNCLDILKGNFSQAEIPIEFNFSMKQFKKETATKEYTHEVICESQDKLFWKKYVYEEIR
jgi:hypothetical protein